MVEQLPSGRWVGTRVSGSGRQVKVFDTEGEAREWVKS